MYFSANKTDLDKFLELYKSFGIELKVTEMEEYKNCDGLRVKAARVIYLGFAYLRHYFPDNISEKFCGYSGFYSDVVFNTEGKFMGQGFWE